MKKKMCSLMSVARGQRPSMLSVDLGPCCWSEGGGGYIIPTLFRSNSLSGKNAPRGTDHPTTHRNNHILSLALTLC